MTLRYTQGHGELSRTMKTIFIPIFQGVEAKNMLRTDIYRNLVEKKDLKIVLFLNNLNKLEYYKREFNHPNLVYEVVEDYQPPSLNLLFSFLKYNLLSTTTMGFRRKMEFEISKNYFKYYAKIIFNKLFARKIFRQIVRWLDYKLVKDDNFIQYYEKYKPDLVFLAHLFGGPEISLLRQAKKRNVATIGLINSWDKITSRCMVRLLPQKLIVHNNIIKKEAMDHLDMRAADIFIAGIPHYDYYITDRRNTYQNFCREIGADPSKKIILYCLVGRNYHDYDLQTIKLLGNIADQGLALGGVQILVRFPPNDNVELDENLQSSNIVFDRPGTRFSAKRGVDWAMDFNDLRRLANTLHHCSLLVCYDSSMIIDAAVFDKPIININFESQKGESLFKNPTHLYQWTHYQHLVKSGGTRFVKDRDELIEWINIYLKNPKIDKDKRAKIVEEQCWQLDGKAGARVADFILKNLEKS